MSGGSSAYTQTLALNAVLAERKQQDAKWGVQNHDPITWLAILTEEVGDAAQEALALRFTDATTNAGGVVSRDALRCYRAEIVQVAAVALAMIECIDRGEWQ